MPSPADDRRGQLRALCDAKGLPIEQHELLPLGQLMEAYRRGLDALGHLGADELRGVEPLWPRVPPTAEGEVPSPDGGLGAEEAVRRAARAIAAAADPAIGTNAFVAVAAPPTRLAPGPLRGLTLAVKDNVDVAGLPTSCGSSFAGRAPAVADAAVVAALRAAGAAVVGKANLGEFAITVRSPFCGETLNPWSLAHGAGGSSGGSAAAVAAGQVDVALGTDSAGSVRIPAAMCGVVGFRPSNGSLSLDGVAGPAWTVDGLGVLARRVEQVGRTMAVLAWAVAAPRAERRPYRVGMIVEGSMGAVEDEVAAVDRAARRRLDDGDLELVPVTLDGLHLAPVATAVTAYVEVAAHHGSWIRTRTSEYGPEARQLVRLGNLLGGPGYVRAQQARRLLWERYRARTEGLDAVLTPTLPTVAAPAGSNPSVPDEDDELALLAQIRFTALANAIGLPAITLPAGLTDAGLPVGVQLMGTPFRDRDLLAIAARVEPLLGFDARPPHRAEV